MYLGEDIPLIGDWLILSFTENRGMAFGMELGGDWGKIILSIFRVIAVIAIAFYLRNLIQKKVHKGLLTAIALIFAGAMGNIIDSAFYGLIFSGSYWMEVAQFMPEEGGYATFLHGNVVDMIKVKYFPAVFNLADFAITLGVIFIIIRQRSFFPKQVPESTEEGTDTKDGEVDLEAGANAQTDEVVESAEPSAAVESSEETVSEPQDNSPAPEEAVSEPQNNAPDPEDVPPVKDEPAV